MDFYIYRIFGALGDSIILSALFKSKGIKRVFYNRAELDLPKQIFKLYGVEEPEFIQMKERITDEMYHAVNELARTKTPLIKPKIKKNTQDLVTVQLGSPTHTAKDRAITLDEVAEHNKYPDFEVKQVQKCKTIEDLYNTLARSKQHISCDSGTGWAAASLGIDTTIISKNSYYFPPAYHYMKYINMHSNVKVYQQHGLGVRMPNEEEYKKAIRDNNQPFIEYNNYVNEIIK